MRTYDVQTVCQTCEAGPAILDAFTKGSFMQDFAGKVAVITGAASGIGKALTEKCIAEGMHVVMVDIEEAVLEKTAA